MSDTTSDTTSRKLAFGRTVADEWSSLDRGWRATVLGLFVVAVHLLLALL